MLQKDTIVYGENNEEFLVENVLGNGAFGVVYEIKKKSDGSTWALKTFFQKENIFPLLNESQMAQQLSHNNVINYAFVHDGTVHEFLPPYIIMELANDGTLQDVIRKNNHVNNFLQMEEILYYFYQLINGMEHINNILVHRDIKPDNILIDNGILKISDFGLSKISNARTRTLTFKGVGALKYLAPEGWKFDKNTIQMDIYSMGIVFYELATNRHPLEVDGEGEQAWQIAHFYSSPTPPHIINTNISPIASQVIMKMIEKNTKNRFSNWKEIRNALEVDDALLNKENKVIDNLVKVQLEKDKIQHQADLQHQRNLKVKHETIKLNNFQFQDQIYNPLKDFIGDFNSRYISGEIKISKLEERDLHNEKLNLKIMLLSGKYISIQFNSLFDEQFIRETYDRFSRATRKAVARPHLDNKRVSAWGTVEGSNGIGFNILLLENEEELYGEWKILMNTNSGFNMNSRRIEPFAFKLSELEKELPLITAMHIYNTRILPLDLSEFYDLISVLN